MPTDSPSSNSRFLLLPELGEPAPGGKQTVVRRYSLTRMPTPRVEPPTRPARRPGA